MAGAAMLFGCGEIESKTDPDGAAPADATSIDGTRVDGATVDATTDGALADATNDAIAGETVTIIVRPESVGVTPPNGRLVIIWFQLNDDGPDPEVEIGYDVFLAGTATSIDIPLAAITPPGEQNLLCDRGASCTDESICPCLAPPKVGIGLIWVLTDVDNNGKIDVPAEMSYAGGLTGAQLGSTMLVAGYSELPHNPAPSYFGNIFPEGILQGMELYIAEPVGVTFDVLSHRKMNTTLEIVLCDPLTTGSCNNLPRPNLT